MWEKSEWIWTRSENQNDVYGEFSDTFLFSGNDTYVYISADSNYEVCINGVFVNSGQYPDFPHYKVYDKLDISPYCKDGENTLSVTVWYYGAANMSYFPGKAALRYEIYSGEKLVCFSSESTLSRVSPAYRNGHQKEITSQLGFSYLYDAAKEDNWKNGELHGFEHSISVPQELKMYERPVRKFLIGDKCNCNLVKSDGNKHFLYDVGREEVGYFSIKLRSFVKQKLTVCYGEHIIDGGVRRIIGTRDFSFEIIVGEGETAYTNYFRRLGLRYLEIFAQDDIEIEYVGVLPCYYPLEKIERSFDDPLVNKIYDVSVRTLELCMHDHYEDCPWREQALYAMDSRNQMLCGYYAFGEYAFPRANLYLMSKDDREDGLLSICTPSGNDLTIPSFSLHYFIEVYEYTKYSGDLTLVREIMPKLRSVLNVFLNKMENGLIRNFTQKCHWNFYEWSDDLTGRGLKAESKKGFDCALNCLLSMALTCMSNICEMLGVDSDYSDKAKLLNSRIFEEFYNSSDRMFVNRLGEKNYSELVNSWAVLCGAAKGKVAEDICEILAADSNITKITLSMACFKYDALLMTDREKYKNYILSDIRRKYKLMLDAGATSFWETEKGDRDFSNAGSLCHGWSAMPVYYYNTLLK